MGDTDAPGCGRRLERVSHAPGDARSVRGRGDGQRNLRSELAAVPHSPPFNTDKMPPGNGQAVFPPPRSRWGQAPSAPRTRRKDGETA